MLRRHHSVAAALALLTAVASAGRAQRPAKDSTKLGAIPDSARRREIADSIKGPPPVPLFTMLDGALAGGFVIGTVALFPADRTWAEKLQNPTNQANRFLNDVANVVTTITEPGAWIIGGGLFVVGKVTGKRDVADLGLHGTEAIVVGSGLAYVMKGVFGRARPFVHPADNPTEFDPSNWGLMRGFGNGDDQSFPSGHTTAAFAAAAAVSNEASRWWPRYRWYVGTLMYGGATAVGLSRMYNNKHWASDVMMGAAIGTFAGNKVVRYYHRTNPNDKLDKWLLSARLVPLPDGALAVAWSVTPPNW